VLKKLSIFMLIGMLMVFIAACGGGGGSSKTANEGGGEEPAKSGDGGKSEYKIQIGYVTTDTDDDPYHISAALFKKYAEEMTDGQVQIELFPNGQLGQEREMVEGMQLGTVDGGVITNAYLSGFAKSALVFDLPFLFADYEQAHKAADGVVGNAIIKELESQGVVGLGWTEGGFRVMMNNVRGIKVPSDAEGIKFRSLENPMYLGMFKNIGANPTPMAWGEVFTSVQQGTVDGLEAPVAVLYQARYHEITKYLSITNHTYSPLLIAVSKEVWDGLPEDIQGKLKEAAAKTSVEQRQKSKELTESLLSKFEEAGVEVNQISNVEDFREKVKSVYEDFRGEIGDDLMKAVGL